MVRLHIGIVPLASVAMATSLLAGCAEAGSEPPAPPAPPALSAMDSNGDGRVTVTEFDSFMAKAPKSSRPDAKGNTPPGPPPSDGSAKGQVPPPPPQGKKGAGPMRPTGASVDANGDGIVSDTEYAAFLKNMPKPGSRG